MDIHTIPIGDIVPHDETRTCWCGPVLHYICPECEEGEGCWFCEGTGAVDAAVNHDGTVRVMHNAVDGRA